MSSSRATLWHNASGQAVLPGDELRHSQGEQSNRQCLPHLQGHWTALWRGQWSGTVLPGLELCPRDQACQCLQSGQAQILRQRTGMGSDGERETRPGSLANQPQRINEQCPLETRTGEEEMVLKDLEESFFCFDVKLRIVVNIFSNVFIIFPFSSCGNK